MAKTLHVPKSTTLFGRFSKRKNSLVRLGTLTCLEDHGKTTVVGEFFTLVK